MENIRDKKVKETEKSKKTILNETKKIDETKKIEDIIEEMKNIQDKIDDTDDEYEINTIEDVLCQPLVMNYCFLVKMMESVHKIRYFLNFLQQSLYVDQTHDEALFLIGHCDYIRRLITTTFDKLCVESKTELITDYKKKHRKEVLKIKNARLVVCNLDSNKEIVSSQFKLLTGEEMFCINVNNEMHSFTTMHKLIIISEKIPSFDRYDIATKRRCVFIKVKEITEEIPLKVLQNEKFCETVSKYFLSYLLKEKIDKVSIDKTDTKLINNIIEKE
jgi:hypothetical protein